jgi:hypothetical protein
MQLAISLQGLHEGRPAGGRVQEQLAVRVSSQVQRFNNPMLIFQNLVVGCAARFA